MKSQILRFHRICSQKTDFELACTSVFQSLKTRGYSARFLRCVKSQTLRDLNTGENFIPSYIKQNEANEHSADWCGSTFCHTCEAIIPCSSIQSNTTNQIFKIQGDLNCNSNNIIYMIECKWCNKQYIGETKRSLRCRFNNHRNDIVNERPSAVASHFTSGMCMLEDCKIIPIFKCPVLDTEKLTTAKKLEIEHFFY